MSGYGNYTPYRARWSNCFVYNNPSSYCPNKAYSLNTKTFIVDNEVVNSKVPVVPMWQRCSSLINLSTYRTGGQRLVYQDISLNEYGTYSGAPAGYGQPPRNTFN